jgi:hypothetical protein
MRIRILVRLCRHKKMGFDLKNILYVGNTEVCQNIWYLHRYESHFEMLLKSCLFVNFGLSPCSWIRIRIANTDPDPGEPNNSESGFATQGLRICLDPDEHRSAFCSEN